MEKNINLENYWQDIDERLKELIKYGSVKLPSLEQFDLDILSENISYEMGDTTFKKLCQSHNTFLNKLDINNYLVPKLYKIAKQIYNFKGQSSDQYHIARKVNPGNSKEMYRAHFDSHIFTMVLPIKIPKSKDNINCGELIYFPNARKNPKNEIRNFIDKLYFKKFASKRGLNKLIDRNKKKIENFNDYQPLLFFGKTTLHTNYPVSKSCSSYRLTLLAHFFDDSSKYGIGNLLRIIRNR
jgi:hypothetical protein